MSLQTKSHNIEVECDTEYYPQLDLPTIPLTIQVTQPNDDEPTIYVHPDSPLANDPNRRHKVFTAPLAQLEGYEWRTLKKGKKNKKSFVVNIEMFFSMKDIQYSCFSNEIYELILEKLNKTRRITIKNGKTDTMRLPYEVLDPEDNTWKILSIRIVDISAALGNAGLKDYAKIAGIDMDFKDDFTKAEKGDMYRMYIERPEDFDNYAKGDCVLHEIILGAVKLFDYICDVLEIEHAENYGMSTGTIVAGIISRAIAKQAGFTESVIKNGDEEYTISPVNKFSQACSGGHPNNIQKILSLTGTKDKSIPYAVMVDGGRAVNATEERVINGVLCDLDIGGCYANGLLNQKFPIGSPTKVINKLTLRQFLKKYEHNFIEGLWYARLSTVKGYYYSFEQDLFVSKVPQQFTLWDNGHNFDDDGFMQFTDSDSVERVYDASMVLNTKQVNQTVINHDLLQVIRNYWSKKELGEFLDNTIVESAIIYEKKNYRPNLDVNEMKGLQISGAQNVEVKGSKLFKIVELKSIIAPLIAKRKEVQADPTKGKKSPHDLILKLILNTVYGCTASEYFTTDNNGISNPVVGNNVTGRVRVLAWCMEKALRTHMSVTDGGVLDVNKILVYKRTSAQIFSDVYYGKSVDIYDRSLNFDYTTLLGTVVTLEELKEYVENGVVDLDKECWNHCSKTFPKLDIFSGNEGKGQFSFEYKSLHWRLIKHNKVDYLLDDNKPALRGAPRVEKVDSEGAIVLDKFGNSTMDVVSEGYQMFEDIVNNVPSLYTVDMTKMLSLYHWQQDRNSKKAIKKYSGLYPHDVISDSLKLFSITPLGCRFKDLKEWGEMKTAYERARIDIVNPALEVAIVAWCYGYPIDISKFVSTERYKGLTT